MLYHVLDIYSWLGLFIYLIYVPKGSPFRINGNISHFYKSDAKAQTTQIPTQKAQANSSIDAHKSKTKTKTNERFQIK